jgi:hypothetical protein
VPACLLLNFRGRREGFALRGTRLALRYVMNLRRFPITLEKGGICAERAQSSLEICYKNAKAFNKIASI